MRSLLTHDECSLVEACGVFHEQGPAPSEVRTSPGFVPFHRGRTGASPYPSHCRYPKRQRAPEVMAMVSRLRAFLLLTICAAATLSGSAFRLEQHFRALWFWVDPEARR